MDRVLYTWSISDHGISTVPYYAYLDLSNGIEDAVKVTTNLSLYSLDDISVDFKYNLPTSTIEISSAHFAFKEPNVCNASTIISTVSSVHQIDVFFVNCGGVSADFSYTVGCANSASTSTASSVTVAASANKTSWLHTTTTSFCDTVTSLNITTTCQEFWESTCSWSVPVPTPAPTDAPTASPVSVLDSCTIYQVVPVRAAIGNVIEHQDLCLPAKAGDYIIDINAKKPYYVTVDSASAASTTINKINAADYATGTDSGEAATGSALVGHSIILIENWYDVMAYLTLDVTTMSSSQSIATSIKIDGLTISGNMPSSAVQDVFKSTLQQQLATELSVESSQFTVSALREGSVIADLVISSTTSSVKSALEISVDLQNFIASKTATTPSLYSPLNSVNNFFYDNQTNDIMFTNCPYKITATAIEDKSVVVEWEEPSIKTRMNDDSVDVYKVIGASSGSDFFAGNYFIRYAAFSPTNASITPRYCSFVIVVDEREWVLEFMGFEFGMVELTIFGTVLFCICVGSICYSVVARRRGHGLCCRDTEASQAAIPVSSHAVSTEQSASSKQQEEQWKNVIVSSHDPEQPQPSAMKRASAPMIMSSPRK